MQTSQVGSVSVQSSSHKRAKFSLRKNLYTTCSFGEVQPVQCLQKDADSKHVLDAETLSYLAALVAPTYGHVKLNFWHYFVELGDITKLWKNVFTKTPVPNAVGQLRYPSEFPWLPHNALSCLFLYGAHCTVYEETLSFDETYRANYPVGLGSLPVTIERARSRFQMLKQCLDNRVASFGGTRGLFRQVNELSSEVPMWNLDIRCLVDMGDCEATQHGETFFDMTIPLSNCHADGLDFFEMRTSDGATVTVNDYGVDCAPVSIDGADFLIEREFVDSSSAPHKYIFAFRMHGIGYRIYKALKGMNFQEDFDNSEHESLMPLFAVWKAYYCSFGIMLFENYEQSSLNRLISVWESSGGIHSDLSAGLCRSSSSGAPDYAVAYSEFLHKFIMDFGSMWVTQAQDYVSANTRSTTISSSIAQTYLSQFMDIEGSNAGTQINIPNTTGTEAEAENYTNSHAFIQRLQHGQLDSELTKSLYLITNRDTVIGKVLEDSLRAQGFGHFVDVCKPRFIGQDVIDVDFTQVLSNADTFDGQKGAIIGERGGNGQAYGDGKKHFYHNDNIGYLISMVAVVPDAGYCQQQNIAFDCVKKEDFYNPEFDGKGYEATLTKYVCGEAPISLIDSDGHHNSIGQETFGFLPTASRFKVIGNTTSGNFARRSVRRTKLCYSTDKFIDLGEVHTSGISEAFQENDDTLLKIVDFNQVFPLSMFPKAGVHWRYPTRYPFLGHFSRIFANLGDVSGSFAGNIVTAQTMASLWEYMNNEDDGFTVMSTFKQFSMDRKLPISDSFETHEDGNKGRTDFSVGKA